MRQKVIYFLVVLLFISCNSETTKPVSLQGNAFGTTYTIQVYNTSAKSNENLQKGIDSVIYRVNKSVSTYVPKSDISRINQGDTTVIIDKIFKDIYHISERVCKNSKGYFDPTIGVLRNAYGFGDVKPIAYIDTKVLDSLMQFVGFHKVAISSEGKILKKHPQIYFDFNAVAKGYGLDCISRYFESVGLNNFLIELGGEIVAKGKNIQKKQAWRVGIETVNSNLDNRSYQATLELSNIAMASSGNYRKFRIDSLKSIKYVHTINPLTGQAEESDITSASVLAPTCALADAYATAFMASGLERSKKILEELPQIETYITFINEAGIADTFITKGFKNILLD